MFPSFVTVGHCVYVVSHGEACVGIFFFRESCAPDYVAFGVSSVILGHKHDAASYVRCTLDVRDKYSMLEAEQLVVESFGHGYLSVSRMQQG